MHILPHFTVRFPQKPHLNCLVVLLFVGLVLLASCTGKELPEQLLAGLESTTPLQAPNSKSETKFAVQTVKGPGYRHALASRLGAGVPLEVVGQSIDGAWFLVRVEGNQSWVARWALKAGPTSQPVPVVNAVETETAHMRRVPMLASSTLLSFGYGLQAHMIYSDIETIMGMTRDLGFDWLKQQVRWADFETHEGSYQWQALDPIVDLATYSDIHLLFSVVASPGWAREVSHDRKVGPPVKSAYLANFLGEMAGRYCGTSLRAIEVWDSQNIHYMWGNLPLEPTNYVALLRRASEAVKRECPGMLVVSGALVPSGSNLTAQSQGGTTALDDIEYMQGMLQGGMLEYVDAVGVHPSGYNVPPTATIDNYCAAITVTGDTFAAGCPNNPHRSFSFRSTMEAYRATIVPYDANIPIWPTEFGWAANPTGPEFLGYSFARDVDHSEQAQWTKEAYEMMEEWGWVTAPILWNLNFGVLAPGTEWALWGIVDQDWVPLPVYDTLKDWTVQDALKEWSPSGSFYISHLFALLRAASHLLLKGSDFA